MPFELRFSIAPTSLVRDMPNVPKVVYAATVVPLTSSPAPVLMPMLVKVPVPPVPVRVMLPPLEDVLSVMLSVPATLSVTPVAPDVLDNNIDEVDPPAPTPSKPSLVLLMSDAVSVTVPLECATTIPDPAAMLNDPPPTPDIALSVPVYDVVPVLLQV